MDVSFQNKTNRYLLFFVSAFLIDECFFNESQPLGKIAAFRENRLLPLTHIWVAAFCLFAGFRKCAS